MEKLEHPLLQRLERLRLGRVSKPGTLLTCAAWTLQEGPSVIESASSSHSSSGSGLGHTDATREHASGKRGAPTRQRVSAPVAQAPARNGLSDSVHQYEAPSLNCLAEIGQPPSRSHRWTRASRERFQSTTASHKNRTSRREWLASRRTVGSKA